MSAGLRTVERYGVTVNDVALAAVTGGFRLLLMSRGEEPDEHTLRSLVPVSTRETGAESVPGNRVRPVRCGQVLADGITASIAELMADAQQIPCRPTRWRRPGAVLRTPLA
jgi:hypothetical protein